ncbi:MAG: glycosyltransferase family 2 protein [Hyphomicrobiales bacterium]|nr:glycosyltransferase family 2 protein [Hyphomicrobiales bacterium]
MTSRKLISICVPVYNEEDNIRPLYERVRTVMSQLEQRYDYEVLFTDNRSEDRTFERLATLALEDKRVRVIRFSRNFGFQRSILANYVNARGAAAVQLDCDLQDPPELIVEFLRRWEEGYAVVYGVRGNRPAENPFLFGLRRFFYRLIDALSEDTLPHDAGDFRLIDRRVIEELRHVRDQQPYLRGLIAAMGFRQIGIPYNRASRERGSSKFSFWRLLGLALDGILHHSIVPLRLATAVGFVMCGLAFLGALYFLIARTFGADWPEGWASLSVLVLFSIGLNALLLGIIGEYIGRIFKNVRPMPLVIIDDVIDHGHGLSQTSTDQTSLLPDIDSKVTRLDSPHKASGA